MPDRKPTNAEIADALDRVADLLEGREENPFRVQAYRNGARTIRGHPSSVAEVAMSGGVDALRQLPGIGETLSHAVREFVETGHMTILDRLQAAAGPEEVLARVPGIGPERARLIHEKLGITTLEELELAAHDGRLEQLEGFAQRRVQDVRNALVGILSRSARNRTRRLREQLEFPEQLPPESKNKPDVETLLEVDAEYRAKAEAGALPTIAPRRFNPEARAWLPVLHTRRHNWSFTILYSNTARAHQLNATRDWVVIYYRRGDREDQVTVVTAQKGVLAGKRVVRGREAECRKYYASKQEQETPF